VVIVVGVLAGIWAVLGFQVFFRDRALKPVRLLAYFSFYAVNATLYFAGVQYLDATSPQSSGIGWPARLLSSIAIALAWAIAISLILDSTDRFRQRREELLESLVTTELERRRESQEADRLREMLNAQVDGVLASTRDRLDQALRMETAGPLGLQKGTFSAAAEVVRSAATDVVRPLSHQLQEMASTTFPPPRLSGVFRQWWRQPRMPPLVTALLVSSQTTAESVRNFGGTIGPLVSLLYFVGLYLLLLLVDGAGRRNPPWRRGLYLCAIAAVLLLNLWFAEGLSSDPTDVGTVLANVLLSITYIAVPSIYDALQQARAGIIDSLTHEIDSEELRTRAEAIDLSMAVDALARELHGRVQTQLVVCAAELDRAAEVGDHEAVTRTLHVAASVLESATNPRESTLNSVVSAWDSLLEVSTSFSGVTATDLSRHDVISVVEEALANAYRHGQAGAAQIKVEALPGALRVSVTDDGSGFSQAQDGLGSRLMRRLSGDRMELQHGPMGTMLTVDLPPVEPRDLTGEEDES
jgi:signal transduction histidine kinase